MSLWVRLFSLLANARNVRASIEQTRAKALQWQTTARQAQATMVERNQAKAEAGDPAAQYEWGERYFEGRGLPQDYSLAAEWFQRAADQGHAEAQCSLGMMHFLGRGVPRDCVEAYKWIRLAAGQENPKAARALQSIVKHMLPDQIAEGQRRADQFIARRTPL
jgi:TPR repeat protein